MPTATELLDRRADGVPHERLADAFLAFDRWTGDDPLLLLAEAAAASTGQRYLTGVRPTAERFRDAFLETGRIGSYADLAALELDDDGLVEAFGAERKRRVLLEAADVLADRPGDDLTALRSWAAEADVYRYDEDPIGAIAGVGPATFQYLRMLAGVDTVKPDPPTVELVEGLADDLENSPLDATEPLRTVASCEWLACETGYRRLEIDRIAWWHAADEDERAAASDDGHAVGSEDERAPAGEDE